MPKRTGSQEEPAFQVGMSAWESLRAPADPLLPRRAWLFNREWSGGFVPSWREISAGRSILVVGRGPAAVDGADLVRACQALDPDLILASRGWLVEWGDLGRLVGSRWRGVIVDAEIDPHIQLLDYPLGAIPWSVLWNSCVFLVPGRVCPERVYWMDCPAGGPAESFTRIGDGVPYRTSGEVACWLASEWARHGGRVGFLGIQGGPGYEAQRDTVRACLESVRSHGAEVVDFSGSGVVNDWLKEG